MSLGRVGALLLGVAIGAGGCPERRSPARRVAPADAAVTRIRPGPAVAAPQPVPHTKVQRAYDRPHRVTLKKIAAQLRQLFGQSLSLQNRGVREPASRTVWPKAREKLLVDAGRIRAQVLAVDPLANRSWAAARASVLLRYLTVKLPDAIRESWRAQPSGAFATWKSDFRLILRRLQRYVENQLN